MARSRTTFQNGHIFSKKTLLKMSLARKGVDTWNKGKTGIYSLETRKKMSLAKLGIVGELHPRWVENREKLQKYGDSNKDRRSSAYNFWRQQVWLRDNLKCKIANLDCKGRIEAHHILSYTDFPELRYQINNGITLCHAHHPRKRAEEKRLIPTFQKLVSVSKELN